VPPGQIIGKAHKHTANTLTSHEQHDDNHPGDGPRQTAPRVSQHPELCDAAHAAAVPAAAILIERQGPFELEFDHLSFSQRAIPLAFDERKVEKDAARCLGRVGDTPAFIVVPVSYDGASRQHIVNPGVGSEGCASTRE
jgi:hypothetical protein